MLFYEPKQLFRGQVSKRSADMIKQCKRRSDMSLLVNNRRQSYSNRLSSSGIVRACVPVCECLPTSGDRLVGLVVKASASRAEGPGFESRLRRDFFGVESYQ